MFKAHNWSTIDIHTFGKNHLCEENSNDTMLMLKNMGRYIYILKQYLTTAI